MENTTKCLRHTISLLILFILISTNLTAHAFYIVPSLTEIGYMTHNEIKTYINDCIIPSYNFRNMQVIFTEDLFHYGFSTKWFPRSNSIIINREPKSEFSPIGEVKGLYDQKAFQVFSSYIAAFAGNRRIPCFPIDGYTAIKFEDLSVFGNCVWNEEERSLRLTLDNLRTYDNGLNITLTSNTVINESDTDILSVNVRTYYYNNDSGDTLYYDDCITNLYSGYTINAKESAPLASRYQEAPLVWLGTAIMSIDTEAGISENPLFEYDEAYLMSDNFKLSTAFYKWEAMAKKESLFEELSLNNYIPLAIKDYYVMADYDGTRKIYIVVKNLSEYPMTGFKLSLKCLDWYGNGIKYKGTGKTTYSAIMQNDIIYSGEQKTYFWTPDGYDAIARIDEIKVLEMN